MAVGNLPITNDASFVNISAAHSCSYDNDDDSSHNNDHDGDGHGDSDGDDNGMFKLPDGFLILSTQ